MVALKCRDKWVSLSRAKLFPEVVHIVEFHKYRNLGKAGKSAVSQEELQRYRFLKSRKYLYAGASFTGVFLLVLLIVLCIPRSERVIFNLENVQFFAGINHFPSNVGNKVEFNISKVSLINLSEDELLGPKNCSTCNTDLHTLHQGQVRFLFWVIEATCTYEPTVQVLNAFEFIREIGEKYYDDLKIITGLEGYDEAFYTKKIGGFIELDGSHVISKNLGTLRFFYRMGVRAVKLAPKCENGTVESDSAIVNYEARNLTEFGKTLVKEMNLLGMIIDIAGFPADLSNEIINVSTSPVMVSNGAAYHLFNYSGNVENSTLELLKANHGIILITFDKQNFGYEGDNITITTVAEHIDFITDKIGFDNIGIGGNFDSPFEKVSGLESTSKFPDLFSHLRDLNGVKWSSDNLEKLAATNFKKFLGRVENIRSNSGFLKQKKNYPSHEENSISN